MKHILCERVLQKVADRRGMDDDRNRVVPVQRPSVRYGRGYRGGRGGAGGDSDDFG